MVREMVELGFDWIELSHGVRITLVPGILKAVEEGIVKISSTHNFCPLPSGIVQAAPNLFEPSSPDERELDQWLRHTKRSLDFAAQVKSTVLVCHLGRVNFWLFEPSRRLSRFAKRHAKIKIAHDPRYQELLAKSSAKLRKRMGPYWDRTQESVKAVLYHAKQRGVRIGCENRERLEELPVDADFPEFISGFPADEAIGYWHDTGHAAIKQTMGLLDQRAQLEKMASRLIGFHLHDVSAQGQDHQPVGSGHVDFKMISEFWKPEHLLVLELSPRVPVDGVRASRDRVMALLN